LCKRPFVFLWKMQTNKRENIIVDFVNIDYPKHVRNMNNHK